MQLVNTPDKIVLPFANAGAKRTIPTDSQIGITAGAASLTDGFPPLTRTPIEAGGVGPSCEDMNGVLYELSSIIRWATAGGGYAYDVDFATDSNVNGYPKGARVMRSDGLGYWFNTVDNNTANPEVAATGWLPDYTTGATSITMTSSNVTLTPLQYGKPLIIITGTLTSDLNLIFPAIVGSWSIINKTSGNYSIKAKTASGLGELMPQGFLGDVVCDGVDIRATTAFFQSSGGSGQIGYIQLGAGATKITVQDKFRLMWLDIAEFGCVSNGVTDDIIGVNKCVLEAKGRTVMFPTNKITRITSSIDPQGYLLNISSYAPARNTHGVINVPLLNNDPLVRVTGAGTPGSATQVSDALENAWMLQQCAGMAIIKCDGCNLIGTTDTTVLGGTNLLRSLTNVVAWGLNGAKIGVYNSYATDALIRQCTFVQFEYFGVLQRAGITTLLEWNAFVENGWNMPATGVIGYPSTYTSGCAIKVISNIAPNDYSSVDSGGRATSFQEYKNFVWNRGYFAFFKPGFMGVQAAGVLGLRSEPEGYTGNFYNICIVEQAYYYSENYAQSGFNVGDGVPYCSYFLNCNADVGNAYAANIATSSKTIEFYDTGNTFLPSYNSFTRNQGNPQAIGASYSNLDRIITVGAAGTTQTYTFKNIITAGGGGGSFGFMGFGICQLTDRLNGNNFSRFTSTLGAHNGSTQHVFAPLVFKYESTLSGAFGAAVSMTFSGQDLVVSVTWGASWGNSGKFQLNIGLFGSKVISI